MSTPLTGYPDHQAYALFRGVPLYDTGYTVTSVTPLFIRGLVTNFASLAIDLQTSANAGMTVTATFFTDDTETVQVGVYTWIISGNGQDLQCIIPCLGDWVVVKLGTGQVGQQQGNITVEPMNVQVTKASYQGTGNFVAGHNVSINPGVTLIVQLGQVTEGNGYFRVECNTAAKQYDLTVNALAEDGTTLTTVARLTNVTGVQVLNFITPACTTQIQIHNDDAAAQTYTFFYTVQSQ